MLIVSLTVWGVAGWAVKLALLAIALGLVWKWTNPNLRKEKH
jgi:hypothetical protein